MKESFIKALIELNEPEVMDILEKRLNAGEEPLEILNDVKRAMDEVGNRFEKGLYFVADLMMAGEILNRLTESIKPYLKREERSDYIGTMVIGTVKGDIHDIGKDIVTTMFEANGFRVIDLGVDVSPERFVVSVREFEPQILGLSALLTSAFKFMKETVEALSKNGLRDKIRIIIGGGTIDDKVKEYVGADAFCRDPVEAIKLAREWVVG